MGVVLTGKNTKHHNPSLLFCPQFHISVRELGGGGMEEFKILLTLVGIRTCFLLLPGFALMKF